MITKSDIIISLLSLESSAVSHIEEFIIKNYKSNLGLLRDEQNQCVR